MDLLSIIFRDIQQIGKDKQYNFTHIWFRESKQMNVLNNSKTNLDYKTK